MQEIVGIPMALTMTQEEEIKYLRDSHHKMRIVCKQLDLLLIVYEELEKERNRSKQLMNLCEMCKEKGR